MDVYINSSKMKAPYIGANNINGIYVGSQKIWPSHIANILDATIFLPLSKNILDNSGKENHPTTYNGTLTYSDKGFDNRKCLNCASYSTALKLPSIVKKNNNFTISVCIYYDGTNNYTGVLGGVAAGNGTLGLGYSLYTPPKSDGTGPDTSSIVFQLYIGGNNYTNTISSKLISQGWNHIVVVVQSNVFNLYVNRWTIAKENSISISYKDRDRNWDGDIWLGRCFQTTSYPYDYFKGYIQDYIYWDRVLTTDELRQLFLFYIGNMVTSATFSIGSVYNEICYFCTGGVGTTPDNIVANGTRIENEGTITISKSSGGIYLNRSISYDFFKLDYISSKYLNIDFPIALRSGIIPALNGKGTFISSSAIKMPGGDLYYNNISIKDPYKNVVQKVNITWVD